MQFTIRSAVNEPRGSALARAALKDMAARDEELFFEAALPILDEMEDQRKRALACVRVCERPEFLLQLIRPDRLSRPKLIELCVVLVKYDKNLDLRLAHLLPHRYEDQYHLSPEAIARILDVLNEISLGPRLVLPLGHLTEHSNPEVAERAVVLMGRRVQNSAWPQRRLSSADEGVRAGALESLWGRDSADARAAMWNCVKDSSHQVAGNAVFGLHLLGEAAVSDLVTGMLRDARPSFRSTAAKVLGRIGKPEYAELLAQAATDSDPSVRLEAKRSLATIRRRIPLPEGPVTPTLPAPQPKPEAPQLEAPTPRALPDFQIHLDGRHTSTR